MGRLDFGRGQHIGATGCQGAKRSDKSGKSIVRNLRVRDKTCGIFFRVRLLRGRRQVLGETCCRGHKFLVGLPTGIGQHNFRGWRWGRSPLIRRRFASTKARNHAEREQRQNPSGLALRRIPPRFCPPGKRSLPLDYRNDAVHRRSPLRADPLRLLEEVIVLPSTQPTRQGGLPHSPRLATTRSQCCRACRCRAACHLPAS